jgi:hypothetical protein
MRDRRHIRNGDHLQSIRLKRADGSLAARTWSFDKYLDRAHTVLHRFARCGLGGDLRCVWSYGVLLREPLNPFCPALDQQTTLPDGSVIVTIVLLKVLWICAWPRGTFFFSRRLPRCRLAGAPFVCCFAIIPP